MVSRLVIMVDVDGVLEPFRIKVLTNKNTQSSDWNPDMLREYGVELNVDRDCVRRLNKLTDTTGAEIVISSSWRLGNEEYWEAFKKALIIWGVRGHIIDRTPHLVYYLNQKGEYIQALTRGQEIEAWILAHPEIENFVALDDYPDLSPVEENSVHIDNKLGIQDNDLDAAISILKKTKGSPIP
jgi:hypothetical protein